jgi:hypothetical protein
MIIMCKKKYTINSQTNVPITPDDKLYLRQSRTHFENVIYEIFIVIDEDLVFVGELKAPPFVSAVKCIRPDPMFIPVNVGFMIDTDHE